VPSGRVSTYGDIATIVGGCDARTVGYALNEIPKHGSESIPWQRVINAQGGISTSGVMQRTLLEDEGIVFDANGHIALPRYRWQGPAPAWAAEHGFNVLPARTEPPEEQLSLF
jgi:methylated-DNA-protein-cysteine methyltransferase related protein